MAATVTTAVTAHAFVSACHGFESIENKHRHDGTVTTRQSVMLGTYIAIELG